MSASTEQQHEPIATGADFACGPTKATLEARGVTVLAAFASGVWHQAIVKDPDGSTLSLHQRYAPRT